MKKIHNAYEILSMKECCFALAKSGLFVNFDPYDCKLFVMDYWTNITLQRVKELIKENMEYPKLFTVREWNRGAFHRSTVIVSIKS